MTGMTHAEAHTTVYGYDAANPLWRQDEQESSHSEVYGYDPANRLTQFKRGTLNENKDDVATYVADASLTQQQDWQLDALGNWPLTCRSRRRQ